MARHHMTPDGPVPFTPEEESEWNAREQEFTANSAVREWTVIRVERNRLLAETDWWVTKAAEKASTINEEQLAYRQALRDITNQVNPFNIAWPTLPSTGE